VPAAGSPRRGIERAVAYWNGNGEIMAYLIYAVLAVLAIAVLSANPWWLLGMPLVGYGFAWVGHFFFERNKPATFRYPLWSLWGDWVMFKDIFVGKIPF